MDTATWGAK